MGRPYIVGQCVVIDGKAVVHAGDLDHTVLQPLHRMVRATVALKHLHGLGPHGKAKKLMAKADAEDGDIGIQQFLNHRHGIFARRGGVARTIGTEYASRLLRHDIYKDGGTQKEGTLWPTQKKNEDE